MKIYRLTIIAGLLIFALSDFSAAQKFENLALTPPMGWNSWNNFGCQVDEKLIRETADALVASGMKDAGYSYVVIDDCWHGARDAQGFIQPDKEHFPSGMKALGDYIHSKGLKFGIYSDVGAKTCGGKPGSRGYEYQDALVYASWGVDYLKYDWCNSEGLNPIGAYTTRDALYKTGRPIVFSICEWGDNKPWEWAKPIGHLWRTTGDITDCWDCEENHGSWSSWGIMRILDKQKGLRIHARPGHWNDPDMMEVGNSGLTINESRAHFSLWAMLAAPLIAGNDVRRMTRETQAILTNREVIAVDQDALGIQGFPALTEDGLEVWVKPLANDNWAVCFLNRSAQAKTINFDWKDNFIKDDSFQKQLDAKKTVYKVRDLWAKKDLGDTNAALKTVVQSHDVVMLKLTK